MLFSASGSMARRYALRRYVPMKLDAEGRMAHSAALKRLMLDFGGGGNESTFAKGDFTKVKIPLNGLPAKAGGPANGGAEGYVYPGLAGFVISPADWN